MNRQVPATQGGLPYRGPFQRHSLRALRLLGMAGVALALTILLLSGDATSSEVNVAGDGAPVEQDVQEAEPTNESVAPRRRTWSGYSTRIPYDYFWSFRSRRPTRMTSLRTTLQRQKSARTRITTLLLICSILAVYGASRWLQAGEIAVEAKTAAAARREELQESLEAYEEKVKISAELARQLADKKAHAAQMQAELQAAAREAEKAEKDLISDLSKQATGGIDFGAILNTLLSEAAAVESEAEALKQKLESMGPIEAATSGDEEAGDSKVKQAYEAQRELAIQKRDLIDKLAHRAAMEAKWKDAIKAEGGDILEKIDDMTKEIEGLKQKKLQLKRETIEHAKQAILLEQKQDAKEELEMELHAMKALVDAKIAANESEEKLLKEQQELHNKKLAELAELNVQIGEAKEKRAKLATDFEEAQKALADALASLDNVVSSKATDPECVSGICKWVQNKLMQRRDKMVCEDIVCQAVEEHKEMQELEKTAAANLAAIQNAPRLQEVAMLESQLSDETLPEIEKKLIQRRFNYLKERIEGAAEQLLKEAREAENSMFLFLEFRSVAKYRSCLEIAEALDSMVEAHPGDAEIESKCLRAQADFEAERRPMLNMLDTAIQIARDRSLSQEINRLFKEDKSPEQALEEETQAVLSQIEETRNKLKLSRKRRVRARKVLISRRAGETVTVRKKRPVTTLAWKRRLMFEITLIAHYEAKLARLEKRLVSLPTLYMDQLERAKEAWSEAKQDYSDSTSRWNALGVYKSALKKPGASEETLETVEDFVEEAATEAKDDNMVAEVTDDESISDDELLEIPAIQSRSFAELIEEEKAQPPITEEPATEPETPEEASTEGSENEDENEDDDDDDDTEASPDS